MTKSFATLVLLLLLSLATAINWQGTGNMSQSDMNIVRGYIYNNFSLAWKYGTVISPGDSTLVNFANRFSTEMNRIFEPAWNIFVVYLTDKSNSDTVLYGYAFRDHWFWLNGVQMNDGYYVGFVIWKDYNCYAWYSFNPNSASTPLSSYNTADATGIYKTTIQPVYNAAVPNLQPGNVWDSAYKLNGAYLTNPSTSSLAFTMIASESNKAKYYARFCAKQYNYAGYLGGSSTSSWGRVMTLQMR